MKDSVPDTTQRTRAFLHESRLPFIGSGCTAFRSLHNVTQERTKTKSGSDGNKRKTRVVFFSDDKHSTSVTKKQ